MVVARAVAQQDVARGASMDGFTASLDTISGAGVAA
jgi:hypothetical protein